MRFIIELDGVISRVGDAWYAAHQTATQSVGWSQLDQATFSRLTRTQGRDANLLPGARPIKIAEYWTRFDQLTETDEWLAGLPLQERAAESVSLLAERGSIVFVTVGTNKTSRFDWIRRIGLDRVGTEFERLDKDARRRPVELRALANREPRSVVVAASDSLVRSAGFAELFCVGISSGTCNPAKLHQAGAALVYKQLAELCETLSSGGQDLVRAGLLPAPLA